MAKDKKIKRQKDSRRKILKDSNIIGESDEKTVR
jgi:hypothetical protein